jgi:hypothetical protein
MMPKKYDDRSYTATRQKSEEELLAEARRAAGIIDEEDSGDQDTDGVGTEDAFPEEERPEYEGRLPKPEISIIVDGQSIYKPGMKTFFVEQDNSALSGSQDSQPIGSIRNNQSIVMGEYCTCDTVLVKRPDYEGIGGTYCACDPHCSCQSANSCPSYSVATPGLCPADNSSVNCPAHCPANYAGGTTTVPCPANYTGGCSCDTVSCNGPCACVPVH